MQLRSRLGGIKKKSSEDETHVEEGMRALRDCLQRGHWSTPHSSAAVPQRRRGSREKEKFSVAMVPCGGLVKEPEMRRKREATDGRTDRQMCVCAAARANVSFCGAERPRDSDETAESTKSVPVTKSWRSPAGGGQLSGLGGGWQWWSPVCSSGVLSRSEYTTQ